MDPAVSGIIKTVAKQPWNLKIFFGIIFDCKPYTTKFMIISSMLIVSGLLLLIFTFVYHSIAIITISLVIINLGGACTDVIGDGEMVRITQKSEDGEALSSYLQSLSWIAYGIGGICGTIIGGSLAKYLGAPSYFIFLLPFPIMLSYMSNQYDAVKAVPASLKLFGSKLIQVINAMRHPKVMKPLIFVFVQNSCGLGIGEGMTYFRVSIGMDAQTLGFANTFAYGGLILGSFVYSKYFSATPIKKIMMATTIIGSVLSLLDLVQFKRWNIQLGLSDLLFLIGFDVVLEVIGRLNLMPLMVLAAKFCPENIEATMFATIMSFFNFTSDIGSLLGSWLLSSYNINDNNYVGLDQLIILRAFVGLIPILFINFLDTSSYEVLKEDDQDIPLYPITEPGSLSPTSPRKRIIGH
eukprot:NODE_438_length_7412_cov_0.582798.p2 type:complete len:409 gc:universal NODE_438_length_7412_cov_0.582798:1-1227(+)